MRTAWRLILCLGFTAAPLSVETSHHSGDGPGELRARFELYAADFPKLQPGTNLLALSGTLKAGTESFGAVATLTLHPAPQDEWPLDRCDHGEQ